MFLLSASAKLVSKLLDEAKRISGITKQSERAKNLSFLERLPSEILLIIHDELETPAQVLLSLTCKRLFDVIAKKLDPSIYNTKERVEISRCLESEWPKYLTCRICGTLFKWHHRARLCYACPRVAKHKEEDRRNVWPMAIPTKSRPWVEITYEVVDLIHRYYERGPKTGIPAGFLNHRGIDLKNRCQETTARWVDGRLIVHSRWTFELESSRAMDKESWRKIDICLHSWLYWREWQSTGNRTTDLKRLEDIDVETFKCRYCACDAIASHQYLENGSLKVTVRAWRDYENSCSNSCSYDQIFRSWNVVRLDQDEVSRRNVRELFDSGEDEQNDYGVKKARKRLEEAQRFYPYIIFTIDSSEQRKS